MKRTALILAMLCTLPGCKNDNDTPEAELIFVNGYVYTSDKQQSIASSVAIRDGEILYVGSDDEARRYSGDTTRVVDLAGKMMLPGLHDVHIHPTGIVDVDMCDLGMEPMNLDALVAALEQCKQTYQYGEGELILALSWNSYEGNDATDTYPSLVAALDAVSDKQPVYLQGPDGHSGAANSYALARVKNAAGEVVGINKTTLAGEFKAYAPFVGVDANGNPNGNLTESALHLAGVPDFLYPLRTNPQELPKIAEKLNRYGITSVQDAWSGKEQLALYKTLADNGDMTFRLTTAQAFDITDFAHDNSIDYSGLIANLKATEASLDEYPYIKADSVKIMVDGVQEGNLFENPPTLPTSVMLTPFKQPLLDWDQLEQGELHLKGYVNTASEECVAVRANPDNFSSDEAKTSFHSQNGFYPQQCAEERGELLGADRNSFSIKAQSVSTLDFLVRFVTELDKAGLTVHMHAVGDGATRAAIDAIETAKAANPASTLPHAIAHMQLVHPDDQQRLGKLGIYLAFTYGWAIPGYDYDLSVIPFVDELDSLAAESLYQPDNYYMQAVYPAKSAKDAGAVLVAGSDAPVDTREPVPFVHMATGISRSDFVGDELITLNADQQLSIHDMLAAYTINGARALNQDALVGSIEVGKRADLIVIDRNVVKLAESDDPMAVYDIAETQVLTTLFDGKVVYNAAKAQ